MIDERKITQAAIAFDSKAEWAEDENAQAIVQYSFRKGAEWAINEFKKSLWHNAKGGG